MSMRALLPLLTLFVGCNDFVDVTAEVVKMDRDGVVIEVDAFPGGEVTAGNQQVPTDDSGKATVTIPMSYFMATKDRSNFGGLSIHVNKDGLITDTFGHTDVDLPMLPVHAAQLPSGDGAWMRIVSSKSQGTNNFKIKKNDFCHGVHVFFAAGSAAKIGVIAPKKATVTIGGEPVKLDSKGLGEFELSTDILIRDWPIAELEGSSDYVHKLPVTVASGSDKKDGHLEIEFSSFRRVLGQRAAKIATGTPLFPKPLPSGAGDKLGVWVSDSDHVAKFAGDGLAGAIDLVAVTKRVGERDGPSCTGYKTLDDKAESRTIKRVYVDLEVTVYDARSAKKVTDKTFAGGKKGCPGFAEEFQVAYDGPKDETVKTWLAELATR